MFLPARRYAGASTSYGPVSVRVCLSQVAVLLKWLGESSCFFLARRLLSTSPTMFLGNSGIYKNKGTSPSLWNFILNSGLGKIRYGIWIVERAINLARERWMLKE